METEQFDNVADLCAAILSKGVAEQLKRGLGREYISQRDTLSSLCGKIDISESIKTQSVLKKKLVCDYDDFSVNTYVNQIIKSTMMLLLQSNISKSQKKDLRKLLVFFDEVDVLDIHTINWKIKYNRNNQTYQMLITICHLVIKGLLQTNSDGTTRLMDFLNEREAWRLYEKFLLAYYRKEHIGLSATASKIRWQLDDGVSTMLPEMQTDIVLSKGENILIIDAKYYTRTTQGQFKLRTIHSGNLYQIFTYVKNKEIELSDKPHKVSGMLLYAKTDEDVLPNAVYQMSGNQISVRTLDLDCDFSDIAAQLDVIVAEQFGYDA